MPGNDEVSLSCVLTAQLKIYSGSVSISVINLFSFFGHENPIELLHRVSKKLCKIVFVRTLSNFHQF